MDRQFLVLGVLVPLLGLPAKSAEREYTEQRRGKQHLPEAETEKPHTLLHC